MKTLSPPSATPRQVLPMLATSAAPFDDPAFLFEVKWDGVRAMVSVSQGKCRVWGREGIDYTDRYPELETLRALPDGTMLDGELVMVRDGRADFHALMSRHARRPRNLPFFAEPVRYVVFDLLYLGGQCLLQRPFAERRELLHAHLPQSALITCCEGVSRNGLAFFSTAIAAGHEGVVAKRLTSRYSPDARNSSWRKIKQKIDLPCVVIGYRSTGGEIRDLAMASLVEGKLAFAGTVELGISQQQSLLRRLESMRVAKPVVPCSLSARWVKPELLCTVRFCGWRPGGFWRDALLVGWAEETERSTKTPYARQGAV